MSPMAFLRALRTLRILAAGLRGQLFPFLLPQVESVLLSLRRQPPQLAVVLPLLLWPYHRIASVWKRSLKSVGGALSGSGAAAAPQRRQQRFTSQPPAVAASDSAPHGDLAAAAALEGLGEGWR